MKAERAATRRLRSSPRPSRRARARRRTTRRRRARRCGGWRPATLSASRPPESIQFAAVMSRSKSQSKATPAPPGTAACGAGLASKSRMSATPSIGAGAGDVLRRRDADRLDDRQADSAPSPRATRAGVSVPWSCKQSGASASTISSSAASSASTVSATLRMRPCASNPSARGGLKVDVARAFLEEDEARHIRAGVDRGRKRLGRGEAADFDEGARRARLRHGHARRGHPCHGAVDGPRHAASLTWMAWPKAGHDAV